MNTVFSFRNNYSPGVWPPDWPWPDDSCSVLTMVGSSSSGVCLNDWKEKIWNYSCRIPPSTEKDLWFWLKTLCALNEIKQTHSLPSYNTSNLKTNYLKQFVTSSSQFDISTISTILHKTKTTVDHAVIQWEIRKLIPLVILY